MARQGMAFLTPEKAYIFRITHIANIPWLLDHGMHCRNSAVRDPSFREIGNPDLIDRRAKQVLTVAPGGTLSDYIAFYFTPRSPMLYNLKTGHNVPSIPMSEIVVLVSSIPTLDKLELQYLLSDRHAVLAGATFSSGRAGLERVDWTILQQSDFKRDLDDPGKMERYQAEALVHRQVPVAAILGLACYGPSERQTLEEHLTSRGLTQKVLEKPGWYF